MNTRTRRQREVFDYITAFIERHGYEPSYQQIARHFRVASKSGIAKHVAALEAQGLLSRRTENGKFSLVPLPEKNPADFVAEIPLVENPLDDFFYSASEKIFVPRFLFGEIEPHLFFAFRVASDSMIDEHICAGDIALFERGAFALEGEIVLALIEHKHPTIERFFNLGAEIELRPANSRLNAVRLAAEFVTIRGAFRGLLRSFQ
jgi:repressor LexA